MPKTRAVARAPPEPVAKNAIPATAVHAKKKWHTVDATDKIVGRLASEVAGLLRGRANPQFTPHTDSGDYVIIVNAEKIKFSGRKD